MSLRGVYRVDCASTCSSTRWKLLLSELKSMITRPMMRPLLISENTMPRSLLSHPSITNLTMLSRNRPITPSSTNTPTIISAKATRPSMLSDAWMYWPIQVATIEANSNDTHTPAMMDTRTLKVNVL